MNNNPITHHRHSIRLPGYDYSQQGAYFITICTQNRICLFGCVENGKMIHNTLGEIARNEWEKLPKRFHNIDLDVLQLMPNHIHGILIICGNNSVGAPLAGAHEKTSNLNCPVGAPLAGAHKKTSNLNCPVWAPLAGAHQDVAGSIINKRAGASPAPTVGNIIGTYKSLVVHECLKIYKSKNKYLGKIWQRNYYEHIIRDEDDYNRIRQYIIENPLNWQTDENYRNE